MSFLLDKYGKPIGTAAVSTTDNTADSDAERRQDAANQEIARRVGEKLFQHYPGHHFLTTVMGGAVLISNPSLTGNFRYVIHLSTLFSDPGMKSVLKAGGEILERYNLRRGRKDRAQYRDLLQSLPLRVSHITVRDRDGTTRKVIPDALR